MKQSQSTRHVAIIGESISHSKSPEMMNAAFQKLGLDYDYSILNVKPEDFKEVLFKLPTQGYAGLTVTIPYKIEIMQYMDEIDPMAQLIGAVNTVKFEDGRMIGYNTDGAGFVAGIEQDFGVSIPDAAFFIIGAGGVARAIVTAIAMKKPKRIYLESLYYSDAQALADRINSKVFDCCTPLHTEDDFAPYIEKSNVVINASFIGMPPHENETPIDPALLNSSLLVADVIYNPIQTKFLKAAEKLGCRFLNGQYQLFHQGKIAFKIWTGCDAPGDVMRPAVFH